MLFDRAQFLCLLEMTETTETNFKPFKMHSKSCEIYLLKSQMLRKAVCENLVQTSVSVCKSQTTQNRYIN